VPKFRFALQAVLDQRERVEQQKQRAVADLEGQRAMIEGKLRGFQQAITQEKTDQRAKLREGDVAGARGQAAAIVKLAAAAQRVVLELAGVHKRLEAARADLLLAAMRRKAVELLRERRHEEGRLDLERRESAEMDEMAVMRAARKEDAA
jgi:flagellar export protein FliJ